MFELDIRVDVRLKSGLQVTLTPDMNKDITKYITNKVLGATNTKQKSGDEIVTTSGYHRVSKSGRRLKKRMPNYIHKWSLEEEQQLLSIHMKYPLIGRTKGTLALRRERQVLLEKFRAEVVPKLSQKAVYQQYMKVAKAYEKRKSHGLLGGVPVPVTRYV